MNVNSKLLNRGFVGLVITQFFGAANDNILKGVLMFMVVDGIWAGRLGDGGQGIVAACLSVPFLLLSGFAGQVADRHSKKLVSVWVKVAEIPIVMVAMVGFWIGNLWLTLAAMVALASQSAFFGPAKYGMIPELVDEGQLSRANGMINMMTNIAVIAGTLAAGWISDAYAPKPAVSADADPLLWLPGGVMVCVAVLGLISVLLLNKLPAGDKNVRYDWNPFTTYFAAIAEMSKTRLLMVMMAWGYFYLLAGIALFIIPEYTQILRVSRFDASILMGVMGIAIGVGCVAAGLISGHRIEPRLIPVGALGLTIFFLLLGNVEPWMPDLTGVARVALSNVSFFILGAGFFAGFYIVPLQALLQKLSPQGERGRFLGTANAVSFAFLTLASGVYVLIAGEFESDEKIFNVCALLMATGAAFFLWRLRGTGIIFPSTKADIGRQGIPQDSLGS